MRKLFIGCWLAGMLLLGGIMSEAHALPNKPFKLFYSFTFANQPQGLEQCGLERMPLLTPSYFFKSSKVLDRVDQAYSDSKLPALKELIAKGPGDIATVNIEGPWTIKRTDSQGTIAAKIDSHVDLFAYLRQRLGNGIRLGVYGEAPLKDFFGYQSSYFGNPLDPMYADFTKAPKLMFAANRQITRLADAADVLFPAHYVFWYDDMGVSANEQYQLTVKSWTTMVRRSLDLAKHWNKPIYPFIWMQYHNRINIPEHATKFLPAGFFAHQLTTLKKLGADGAVIWGTLGESNGRAIFDKNASWWKETIAFARKNGADLSACKLLPSTSVLAKG